MPSIRSLMRRAACLIAALLALQAFAQAPAATPAETPLKEISVAANAFVRGAPLPAWADLLPLPPPSATRRALALRLDETQLFAGDKPVVLVNAAEQVNDAGALGQIGQIAVPFNPQYQRLSLHKVLILRGGEAIDHTADVQVRFLQREAGLEQGIYSGVITASLLLPDVRVGDTLHLQYSIEGANPIFGGRYLQNLPWQRTLPVQVRRVTLLAPENRTIRWQWNGDGAPSSLAPELDTVRGLRRMRFEEHEMPGVEIEPMLPKGAAPLRWLQFSEFADWGEVARWADGLFPPDEPLPAELTPLLQRWSRLPGRAEQAAQALQWVQSEIRYYSVSLGESSHRPHSPAEVLKNRYGDCKDKSFLLMRLLQSLGIPAHAVLASIAAPQGPAKLLASPLAFDHAIVVAHIDGRDHYLDPTRLGQRGPLERMGQAHEEASVLVVDGRETHALSVVRSPNRREIFRNELAEKFHLDAFGGDGTLESELRTTGVVAETLRLSLARFDTARLQRVLQAGMERRYPGLVIDGAPELVDEVDQNRITVRVKSKVPKLATLDAQGRWVMRFVPANLQGMVLTPPSTTRQFPLALPGFPATIAYSAEMQWPQSVSAIADPGTLRIADAAFNAEVSRSFRGNVSRVALQFEPLTNSVPAKDVPAMVNDLRKMERAIGSTMVVSRDQIKVSAVGAAPQSLQQSLRARSEAVVQRTGQAIAGGQLAGDDLAQALCLRAQAQDELGRHAEALKDAREAVRQGPSLGLALFCRGNVLWNGGEFAAAAADFGQALALGHDANAAYYRRGQARFFEGRLEPAADDFAKASADLAESAAPVYPQLWLAWTLQRLGRPLPPAIAAAADPNGVWPRPALALFTGRLTPAQLIEQVDRRNGDERELAAVEAWFYIGEYWLVQNDPAKAREAFERAREKGITQYVEHAAAGFELQRLGAAP